MAFSAVLIALQCGLLLGLFSVTSIPVDRADADIWIGAPHLQGVDLGRPIPSWFMSRLANQEEVEPPELYIQSFTYWSKPGGGSQLCLVVGARLEDDSIGLLKALPRDLREKLSEPNTVVVDRSEMSRLGIRGVGDTGEIFRKQVQIVGLVDGLPSFAGPYIFCSLQTARRLLHMDQNQTTYVLARCRNPGDAERVVERLRVHDDMTVFTKPEFSFRTQWHWLTTTKAGIALGYTALLGLLVGAIVTSQTLYSATAASFREYATLEALGIPRFRMALVVLSQAFWIGVTGIVIGFPIVALLTKVAELVGVHVLLPLWLVSLTVSVTLGMALLSGLFALRSLRHIDVYSLLR